MLIRCCRCRVVIVYVELVLAVNGEGKTTAEAVRVTNEKHTFLVHTILVAGGFRCIRDLASV